MSLARWLHNSSYHPYVNLLHWTLQSLVTIIFSVAKAQPLPFFFFAQPSPFNKEASHLVSHAWQAQETTSQWAKRQASLFCIPTLQSNFLSVHSVQMEGHSLYRSVHKLFSCCGNLLHSCQSSFYISIVSYWPCPPSLSEACIVSSLLILWLWGMWNWKKNSKLLLPWLSVRMCAM